MTTAYFLDEQADEAFRRGEDLKRQIEQREAELVNLREHRDKAFVMAVEMRKNMPGSATAPPAPSSPIEMPYAWNAARNTVR